MSSGCRVRLAQNRPLKKSAFPGGSNPSQAAGDRSQITHQERFHEPSPTKVRHLTANFEDVRWKCFERAARQAFAEFLLHSRWWCCRCPNVTLCVLVLLNVGLVPQSFGSHLAPYHASQLFLPLGFLPPKIMLVLASLVLVSLCCLFCF